MNKTVARWAPLAGIVGVILVADQLSKSWIVARLPLGSSLAPFPALEKWFKLLHVGNTGSAFGLIQDQNTLLIVLYVAIIAGALFYTQRLPESALKERLSLALLIGGAGGNLIDRIRLGHVTDFLYFTLPVGGRVYEWPAFNVADSCIVVGAILMALWTLLSDLRATREQREDHPPVQPDS